MKKLNLNISKDDQQINDFLYSWDKFGERPNKISLYDTLDYISFMEVIDSLNNGKNCISVEILVSDEYNLVNRKVFTELTQDTFLSYTNYDSENESGFISDINIYCNSLGKDLSKELMDKFLSISEQNFEIEGESKKNTFLLTVGPNGIEENYSSFLNIDSDNIELYYNDSTFKQVKKTLKNLKINNRGLTVIYGERGTGKTSLIKYFSEKIDKKFIFIPCLLFETTIANPDFRNYLQKNPDSIIIIDDSDIYFSEIYSKSNIFTNNILQLVDGLDSQSLNLNIIAILNVDDIDKIDHVLLDCNNLSQVINIDSLELSKIKELSKHLKIKTKFKDESNLINVLKNKTNRNTKDEVGF